MSQLELLSYCGLFCGGCRSYKENSDIGCQGCREEKTMLNDCLTRKCAMEKGFLHCGECEIFPCGQLNNFYHDGIAHHALAYENVKRIKAYGPDQWLSQQEILHTCSCGKKRLWFAKNCQHRS